MGKPTILSAARFVVAEDQREQFEAVAAELVARAEKEPGTLMYRFFRGEHGHYSVIEEYEDADAARIHQQANVDLLERINACAGDIALDLHGPVGPSLREWAKRVSGVTLYEDAI